MTEIHDRDKLLIKNWKLPDGIIQPDSPEWAALGFTSDKFEGYLWRDGGSIWVSFIQSLKPRRGNLKSLFDAIEAHGYSLIVPTPLTRMQQICEKRGMNLYQVLSKDGEIVHAMCQPPIMPKQKPTQQ